MLHVHAVGAGPRAKQGEKVHRARGLTSGVARRSTRPVLDCRKGGQALTQPHLQLLRVVGHERDHAAQPLLLQPRGPQPQALAVNGSHGRVAHARTCVGATHTVGVRDAFLGSLTCSACSADCVLDSDRAGAGGQRRRAGGGPCGWVRARTRTLHRCRPHMASPMHVAWLHVTPLRYTLRHENWGPPPPPPEVPASDGHAAPVRLTRAAAAACKAASARGPHQEGGTGQGSPELQQQQQCPGSRPACVCVACVLCGLGVAGRVPPAAPAGPVQASGCGQRPPSSVH